MLHCVAVLVHCKKKKKVQQNRTKKHRKTGATFAIKNNLIRMYMCVYTCISAKSKNCIVNTVTAEKHKGRKKEKNNLINMYVCVYTYVSAKSNNCFVNTVTAEKEKGKKKSKKTGRRSTERLVQTLPIN